MERAGPFCDGAWNAVNTGPTDVGQKENDPRGVDSVKPSGFDRLATDALDSEWLFGRASNREIVLMGLAGRFAAGILGNGRPSLANDRGMLRAPWRDCQFTPGRRRQSRANDGRLLAV